MSSTPLHRRLLAPLVRLLVLAPFLGSIPAAAQGPIFDFPASQSPTVATTADGGFLAAFVAGDAEAVPMSPDGLRGVEVRTFRIANYGGSAGPTSPVVEVPPGGDADGERLEGVVVASTGGDANLLVWSEVVPAEGTHRLLSAPVADGLIGAATVLSDCEVEGRDVVAAGNGYWAVWKELCAEERIVARRLDAGGLPVGPTVVVSPPAETPGSSVDAAGLGSGGVVVTWVGDIGDGDRILARAFTASGSPDGGVFPVSPTTVEPVIVDVSLAPRVGAFPDGGLLFAWSTPSTEVRRRYGAPGQPLGGPDSVDQLRSAMRSTLGVATNDLGFSAVYWYRELPADQFGPGTPSCFVQVYDPSGNPVGDELVISYLCHPEGGDLAFSNGGVLVAAWQEPVGQGAGATFRANYRAVTVAGVAPPGAPIVSPEFQDFRFWVQIGGPDGVTGTQEIPCLPETVCVSGALPGRTEVLLRIVGPKPNGRLWPTLVKLSTSPVEVWVEQVSSGLRRYYRLPGARPGFDELPGLFDRAGFDP